MSTSLVDFKKNRIEASMSKHNLKLIIGSLPENVFYISGYRSISQQILHRAQAFGIYQLSNSSCSLVVPCAEVATVIEQLRDMELYNYGNFYFTYTQDTPFSKKVKEITDIRKSNPGECLIEAIKKSGVTAGRIGLDESRVTPQLWREISDYFSNIEFIPASNIFSEIRMIKHSDEVSLLEKAAEITELSLFNTINQIKPGMTELEIGRLFKKEIIKRGADPFFNVVSIDKRSALADTINTNNSIHDGSVIRFDIGCNYKGYRSDIARTAVIGNYDQRFEDYYESILVGEEVAVDSVKPGVTAEHIYNVAMKEVRSRFTPYERQHCGHGIGLEVYDPPIIGPGVHDVLQPGMVLCVETPYYELDWGGVQVEDTIVVTETGSRYLTKSSRNLIKIGG
jgi:Xaa-Pro dipeptidase